MITNFGGKKISSVDALRFAVDAKHPGDVVHVTLLRDGQSQHRQRDARRRGPQTVR